MALMTERQRKAFRGHSRGWYSLWILVFFIFLATAANFIANSRPLLLIWEGKTYFPVLQTVTYADLGVESRFLEVNFRSLQEENPERGTFLWPPLKWGPNESDRSYEKYPSLPDSKHVLGTDDRGRDLAARLLYGLRNSLIFAVCVWMIAYFIGIVVGGLQGYFGGWIDFVAQRIIEVISAIPSLFLLIILVSMFRANLLLLVLFTALVGGWISISYYMRAEFLKLRKLEFVEAARALGFGRSRVLWRHILPNGLTPVLTFSPFALTAAITGLAGLDYLGFGLPPPAASWGEALNQAQRHFDHAFHMALFPSLALMSTLLVLTFIGEGLRHAMDPRSGV
jgi:microcin C transport system permease protein